MTNNINTVEITINAAKADTSKAIICKVTDEQACQIFRVLRDRKYTYENKCIRAEVLNAVSFSEALKWAKEVKLSTTHYVQTKTLVKVINLPEGITFTPSGQLWIQTVPDFKLHTHETILEELKLAQWVMETFPNAVYGTTRAGFLLPTNEEETVTQRSTTKRVFSISKSGDRAVEVTTRIYKKVTEEI